MDQVEDELTRAIRFVYALIVLGVLIWLLGVMTKRLGLILWVFVGYQLMIWYALAGVGVGIGSG